MQTTHPNPSLRLNIIGTGKGLPSRLVPSTEIDALLGIKEGRTEKLSGLAQRYFLADDESADAMQLQAAKNALAAAGITIDDVDCVINASGIDRQCIPFNAAHTLRLLKPTHPIAAFDVNMTCLSFLRSLDLADSLLHKYPTILLISCDVASVGLDWNDFHSSTIFGDGAAAAVIRSSERGGVLTSKFEVHPEGYEFCTIPAGGYENHPSKHPESYVSQAYFHMNGKKLYKLAAEAIPGFLDETLAQADLTLADIDWIVPHQASRGALQHIISRLKLDPAKIVDIFNTHGNQISASIPSALHHLLTDFPVRSGDKVLLFGPSAGVGLGALVWEKP